MAGVKVSGTFSGERAAGGVTIIWWPKASFALCSGPDPQYDPLLLPWSCVLSLTRVAVFRVVFSFYSSFIVSSPTLYFSLQLSYVSLHLPC